ncbi:MAG: DUF4330 domain-containing protein [Actinobacteria bacterium]|nr:MAG: DUF4330 domain-containing protein [Actinomycetota bacterium]
MKLLDDRMRLFGLVNPIDIVAVLLVIAVAVVGYTLLKGEPPAPPSEKGTVEVVFLAQGIPTVQEDLVKAGDVAARSGGTGKMGEVTAVRFEKSVKEATDATGSVVVVESDLFRDVYVTVRGTGAVTDTGVNLGDERIRVNQVFDLQMPRFQMSARVISARQVD